MEDGLTDVLLLLGAIILLPFSIIIEIIQERELEKKEDKLKVK